MSEAYGPDFITVTDEEGNEFELELIDTLEHHGVTYHALFPAAAEGNEDAGDPVEVDADDEEYGLVIMKVVEENGEELFCSVDDEEELVAVYDRFMELLFDEETDEDPEE